MNLLYAFIFLFLKPASTVAEFATEGVQSLESQYLEDCQANVEPHGFYGAFLQPCEFAFYQFEESVTKSSSSSSSPCEDGILLDKPVPMHWFFNLTKHFKEGKDWDNISSDDWAQISDTLLLWPDQCVGVVPRCYPVQPFEDVLTRLFPREQNNSIPVGATHVRVDCRGDAAALSRVVYAAAESFEVSLPTLIAWMVTVVLLFVASTMWCAYGCFRLCCTPSRVSSSSSLRRSKNHRGGGYVIVKDPHDETPVQAYELQKDSKAFCP